MPISLRLVLLACAALLAGCDADTANDPDPDMNIAVQVNGLNGTLALFNSGIGSFGVTGTGNYTVATRVRSGRAYQITVARQPHGQTCVVSNGSGTSSTAMTTVTVNCATSTFPINVDASGFTGKLMLTAGNETLVVSHAGSATFATPVSFGEDWAVGVEEEPVGHACSISNNSGNAITAISPVQVTCVLIDPLLIRKVTVVSTAAKTFRVTWQEVPGATHYRLLRDNDGVAGGALTLIFTHPTQLRAYDSTVNSHLAATAIYVVEACNASRCVAAPPVAVPTSSASGYLKAPAQNAGDSAFGDQLAISSNGTTLFVRGKRAGDDWEVNAYNRGAYQWLRQKNFSGTSSFFGAAMSTSASGSILAVSDGPTIQIHQRTAGVWNQEAMLVLPLESSTNRWSVRSLALSGDGNSLAVGAHLPGMYMWNNGNSYVSEYYGKVYMYQRESGIWTLKATLMAPVAMGGDSFGTAVALSYDGATLAVGAPLERSSRTGIGPDTNYTSTSLSQHYGAAYVLVRNGNAWSHQIYLKPTAAIVGTKFGNSVSLSTDGNYLAVGAPGDKSARTGIYRPNDMHTKPNAGAAYVYGRTGTTWVQNAYIKASVVDADDAFGSTVSLSGDGRTLAVSVPGDDSAGPGSLNGVAIDNSLPDSGAVLIFRKPASSWAQHRYLKAPLPDSAGNGQGDAFGSALGLSSDATTLAVTSLFEDGAGSGFGGDLTDNSASNSGAVFLH